ncbi:MAG: hypothetical protein AVDCRST_MAG73-1315 [uncultured Thermomicrobiales bacterium]|uniref:Zinc-ribbon domain-containing protein n=1 Tax=uncultured Thermomicrobiales bacterium TaxID=1645740 RepID=A0A6J4TYI0_9BACT|nr:MAG: hypothetical protein AVDCRST_MAG73-1315 [uncultured Thermomicrobiales bacterium]
MDDAPPAIAPHPRIACPHCGDDVERRSYCGNCGRPTTARGGEGIASRLRGTRLGHALPPLFPAVGTHRASLYRRLAALGAALTLIALLANATGLAIAIAACVVPLLVTLYWTDTDVYEREPMRMLAAVSGAGFAVGIVAAIVSTLIYDNLWFDAASLHPGAAGFPGRFADGQGAPPGLLVILVGLVVPVAALAGALAAPIGLRRWPEYRNEVMDGVALGAAAGGGVAVASALVYVWPVIRGADPKVDTADWTATLIGLLLIRPLILSSTTALVAAGIWHFALTQRSRDLAIPVGAGLAGTTIFAIGDLISQGAGTLPELIWGLAALALGTLPMRHVLGRARIQDQKALGGPGQRVVCPTCHRITPVGAFCARCGAALPGQNLAPSSPEPAEFQPATPPLAVPDLEPVATPDPDPTTDPTPAAEGTERP